MNELVTVTVSVPRNRLSDLYMHVATLNADEALAEATSGVDTDTTPGVDTEPGFQPDAVREAYLGGVSDYWRPFLDELAAHPDEELTWNHLCDVIGLEPNRASGMLGAAERRCHMRPPYKKYVRHGQFWFVMPKDVAEIIRSSKK